ncbi:MAG: hypothetical protein FK730_03380 [Asgard group archaeon]|nr:hypothetical protein [Asgard group archaeon]
MGKVKKQLFYKLFIIIFLLLLIHTPICAQIEVGDILYYKVITSKVSAEIGENKITTKGFSFDGEKFPSGTKVKVTVNYVGGGMNGLFEIGENSRSFGYTTGFLESKLQQFIKRTSLLTTSLLADWERENFENGFYFYLYPYIDPINASWEFLDSIGKEMMTEMQAYEAMGHVLMNEYRFEESVSNVYLETWNYGEIIGQYDDEIGFPYDLPVNSIFYNRFQISFEKTTGKLLGMRMKGSVENNNVSQPIDVAIDYQIENEKYNLPFFKLNNNKPILISIFIPISTLVIIFPVVFTILFIRKKKMS